MIKIKEKKILWMILAIIILVFILIFLLIQKNKNSFPKENNENRIIDNLFKIKDEYKNSQSFNDCLEVGPISGCLESEIRKKVQETGKVKYCNDLLDVDAINSCIDNFNYKKVVEAGILNSCNSLSDEYKRFCREKILINRAVAAEDLKECIIPDDINLERECINRAAMRLAQSNLDSNYCNEIDGFEKDMCFFEVKNKKDILKAMKKSEENKEPEVNSEL